MELTLKTTNLGNNENLCLIKIGSNLNVLGSKTLGTNILELQFVLRWQTMTKTWSQGLGLLKVCLFVKLELSDCITYWTKSARLDRSKIRLDSIDRTTYRFIFLQSSSSAQTLLKRIRV